MLIYIIGDIGSGKTLFLTRQATKLKRDIYSNFFLKLDNYYPLDILTLLDLKSNVNIFIDEGYTWLESRTPSKVLNRYISYIVLQSRKRGLDIYMTAQLYSSVDLRFRDQANIIIKCERLKSGFFYTIIKRGKTGVSRKFLSNEQAEKYYPIYDTLQIIEPEQKKQLEFHIIKEIPDLLKVRVKEIAKAIAEQISPITHDSVKSALLTNGYPIGYETFVYLHLKGSLAL